MSTARVLAEYLLGPPLDENTVITELWLEYIAVRQEAQDEESPRDLTAEES